MMNVSLVNEPAMSGSKAMGEVPHPGYILAQNFMRPLGLTIEEMAQDMGFPVLWLERIISGERRVSYTTALRLGGYFHTTTQFWLDLQEQYDATHETIDPLQLLDSESGCRCSTLPCTGIGPGMNAASVRQLFTAVKTKVH